MICMKHSLLVSLLICCIALPASADEGLDSLLADPVEPAPRPDAPENVPPADEPGPGAHLLPPPEGFYLWFEAQLAFGYASLLSDPDVGEGYGGGVYLTLGLHRRLGLELSVYFANNPYDDELGAIGSSFLSGNITVGPVFCLLRPENRLQLNLDLGIGGYLVVNAPGLRDPDWTLGISGGASISYRVLSWLGVGLKVRYHLFNLAGGELKDIRAFRDVGVLDRLDLPIYIDLYF